MSSLEDRLGFRMLQRLAKQLRDKFGEKIETVLDENFLVIQCPHGGELYIELIAHDGRIVDQNVHEFGEGWASIQEAFKTLSEDYIS